MVDVTAAVTELEAAQSATDHAAALGHLLLAKREVVSLIDEVEVCGVTPDAPAATETVTSGAEVETPAEGPTAATDSPAGEMIPPAESEAPSATPVDAPSAEVGSTEPAPEEVPEIVADEGPAPVAEPETAASPED